MMKRNILATYKVLKQPLKHGLLFLKMHTTYTFNRKTWLKPRIDMNAELRKERMLLKKIFSSC